MATSGTITFRTNRNEIIEGALRLVGGIDPENSSAATASQITNGAQALNLMVKAMATQGLQLWERKYAVIFPQESQGVFVLGSPGPAGDHACLSTPLGSGFVQTTLDADAASGATTIVVDSVTSRINTVGSPGTTITNAYNIGVELDDGSVQWTTVNGAPSGTTVTLAAALTDDASEGNTVYCYQTKMTRPLRVLDAFIRQTSGQNDTPCRIISREDYNRFGLKTSTGTPVQLYYDPRSNTGHVYMYPEFLTADTMLYLEIQAPIEDFSSSTDDYDLPQEWGEALKYNLAIRIAPEYEVPQSKFSQLKYLAETSMDAVTDYDQESPSSVQFQPSNWTYMTR